MCLFTFTRYYPGVLERLNAEAKPAGLHVAAGKKDDRYSVRKIKNGKSVAKNVSSDEVLEIIAQRSE